MAHKPTIQENPEAAYNRFRQYLEKANVSQVLTIGRSLEIDNKILLIAKYILQKRMAFSNLPSEEAVLVVQALSKIHKEIQYGLTAPGEILKAGKEKRPRAKLYGGRDFFVGNYVCPVDRVAGMCTR
jgi:hypothetical protein